MICLLSFGSLGQLAKLSWIDFAGAGNTHLCHEKGENIGLDDEKGTSLSVCILIG